MSPGETLINVIFYTVGLLALFCALVVAFSPNIVRSAFALLGVLSAAACVYLLAWADFLMGVQVLVYIGGILVLIIFAVMLTHRITNVKLSNESSHNPAALFAVLCFLFALGRLALSGQWPSYESRKRELVASGQTPGQLFWDGQPHKGTDYQALPEHKKKGVTARVEGLIPPKVGGQTKNLGRALMKENLLPFEAISVLLLAALVGAAYLARKEVRG